MDAMDEVLALLPPTLRERVELYRGEAIEEVRLRAGQLPALHIAGQERLLPGERVCEEQLLQILERATAASLHAAGAMMRGGYLCCGSLRIGICGTAIERGHGTGFRSYSSLAIRLFHECRGVCRPLMDELYPHGFANTLLLSPPGGGKSTALRDLIRCLSAKGLRVAVADERGELFPPGVPAGEHCDVLCSMDKARASVSLLRTMSPQLIAMDEISAPEDIAAVQTIVGCGVGLLATAHAADVDDLRRRALYRSLLEEHIFSRAVVITQRQGERHYCVKSLEE